MGKFGYSSYKGRGGARKFIVMLLIIVCAVVGIFIYVAVSDGLDEIVRRPDTQTSLAPPVTQTPPPAPTLVVETATPPPSPSPSPKAPAYVRAYHIADITDHEQVAVAVQAALAGRVNTAVVRMKNDLGELAYASKLTPDFAADTTPLSHLDELRDAGLYLIAEVYAFEDSVASNHNRSWSVATRNGTRWLDWQYHGWLNPKNDEVRGYLLDVSREVLELGFDKILYMSFDFPRRGRPELLYYEDETPEEEVLASFKQELADEFGDILLYDAPVYVEQ